MQLLELESRVQLEHTEAVELALLHVNREAEASTAEVRTILLEATPWHEWLEATPWHEWLEATPAQC